MLASRACSLAFCAACCCTAIADVQPALETAHDGERSAEAIWRAQQVEFDFRSAQSRYACGALRAKIGAILRVVGARRDVDVRVDCPRGETIRYARVRIALASPVLANEENIARATTFDTRDRLVARLNAVGLPTASDIERFPAEWRTISFARLRGLRLDAGDCQLLHDLREQIFPRLGIRTTRRGPPCAMSASRMPPVLEVAALVPMQHDAPIQ